jgi:multimeric flavodoxin WrbA
MVQLSGEHPHGCIACYQCFKKKDGRCVVDLDCINSCVEKMVAADGIVLASPTYFADISTEMKALIDRCGMVSRANGDLYKRKVGAAIVTQRRGGGIHAFDSMNHFFTISQMIIVGSSYWNIGFGREKGEVANDAEAINVMRDLGKNMAWLLKKIHA